MLLVLLVVLLAGIGAGVWFIQSQLGTRADGTRVSLVLPGPAVSIAAKGSVPITVAPELAGNGVMA